MKGKFYILTLFLCLVVAMPAAAGPPQNSSEARHKASNPAQGVNIIAAPASHQVQFSGVAAWPTKRALVGIALIGGGHGDQLAGRHPDTLQFSFGKMITGDRSCGL